MSHLSFPKNRRPSRQSQGLLAVGWTRNGRVYATDDVLDVFEPGWNTGTTEFKGLIWYDIEGLMTTISAQYPEICFYVRGMGEEFHDVWLREFKGGKIVFTLGPFEEIPE
jgi:hypothetical protein